MIRFVKFGLLAVGLLVLPLVAFAQTRTAPIVRPAWHPMRMARPAAARAVASPTHPIIIRVPVASTTRHADTSVAATNAAADVPVFPNGTGFVPSTAASFDLNQLLNNVPGLGFDYSHVAALNGNLGERAFIDPVTQQDIALSEQLARNSSAFSGGFIPFWGGYGGYSEPVVEEEEPQAQAQPRVIIFQEPPPGTTRATQSTSSQSAAQAQPPLPSIGEFTLVLRDGSKIKAVAFTQQDDQIVYITSDGARNSFPISKLDVDATQRLNQQHGTPLHLSL